MNDAPSYERIFKLPKNFKNFLPRIELICLYLAIAMAWLLLLIRWKLLSHLILLAPLSLLLVILLTWKYGSAEYEYIFSGGTFCFSKIYGKQKRKELLSLNLEKAVLIAPKTPDNLKKADGLNPEKVYHATVNPKAEDIWLIVFESDKKEKATEVVFFHADERTVRFLRRTNPHATVRYSFS